MTSTATINGVHLTWEGRGPPVLLLHGFPETHLMWREIAPELASSFTVVCADLPGCGRSHCPLTDDPPDPLSKRAMARTLRDAMAELGFEGFAVVGHDRGGRVAYRMALDWPETVLRLVALDIVPTAAAWERADARFALSFWPFSLLAQPEPLPETLLTSCPEAIVDAALSTWGTPAESFPREVRDAYVEALRDPDHAHAICEEYRAAATVDRDHDNSDRAAGRRITCPLLVLWSEAGGLNNWYRGEGGPLGLWAHWAERPQGGPVRGGHFFPEEHPFDTAAQLRSFLET